MKMDPKLISDSHISIVDGVSEQISQRKQDSSTQQEFSLLQLQIGFQNTPSMDQSPLLIPQTPIDSNLQNPKICDLSSCLIEDSLQIKQSEPSTKERNKEEKEDEQDEEVDFERYQLGRIDEIRQNKHVKYCLKTRFEMGRMERLNQEPRLSESVDELFKEDWIRDAKRGQFQFINKKKISDQKSLIASILSSIGSNIIKGKSLTQISLPIKVFESRSNLERFAYSNTFAPIFLERASSASTPLEQMKNTLVYIFTNSLMYLNMSKPFNPILGETYQGRINGYPFYCEQISHHPPISACSYVTDSYHLNFQMESVAMIHPNSISGKNSGNWQVTFKKTANTIFMIGPSGRFYGTMFGRRHMSLEGRIMAIDISNRLVFEVILNPKPKKGSQFEQFASTEDFFAGGIYRINETCVQKLLVLKRKVYQFKGLNLKEDILEQLATVHGIWNQEVLIDGEKWFDASGEIPFLLEDEENPIPSDSSYRLDIIALRNLNLDLAQKFKIELEEIQRRDRKLREKSLKESKKKILTYHISKNSTTLQETIKPIVK